MKNFSALALSALLLASVSAEAQQPKVPRIGFLSAGSASTHSPRDEAFRQGLRDLGMRREKTLSSSTGLPKAKLNASPI
jgi:Skp family chaperone for outer membrane proteins